MNRYARRQAERSNTKQISTYTLTAGQLQKLLNDAVIKDRKETVNKLYAVFTITLHDKLGFGHKRLARTLGDTSKQFECIMYNYVTFEDIYKECEKLGIHIK